MMRKINIKSSLILGVLFLSIFQFSCKKDDPNPDEAPNIPDISTFRMAMSDDLNKNVSNADSTVIDTTIITDTTFTNWLHSGVNVFVWNIVIVINMAIPVVAYAESFNHIPKYISKEKRWKWEYTTKIANVNYTMELYGKIDGDFVDWEMFISQTGGFQNVKWYTGRSKNDRTSGSWTLYSNTNNPTKFLAIDWSRNTDGTIAETKYTNIVPGGNDNGGFIEYRINENTGFNAFYNIFNKSQDNLTEIEWNRTNKNGHVKDPNKFLDSDWHCWNVALYDINCP